MLPTKTSQYTKQRAHVAHVDLLRSGASVEALMTRASANRGYWGEVGGRHAERFAARIREL